MDGKIAIFTKGDDAFAPTGASFSFSLSVSHGGVGYRLLAMG
jgi:hypothetical protein